MDTDPCKIYSEVKSQTNKSKKDLERFTVYTSSSDLMEKWLVYGMSGFEGLENFGTKLYDYLMRKFIKEEFDVEVVDIHEKWMKICWSCKANGANFTCSTCQMAKYCGTICQKRDWKVHKMIHDEIKRAKSLNIASQMIHKSQQNDFYESVKNRNAIRNS